mmetsp:Transcript_23057/g.91436  ORF Transcript_23057/g.91436 Transcript_23057/m.91436 type:complete len:254 (+) Transcript_23057:620-1381(+)
MNMLNLGTSSMPSTETPHDETIERSWTFLGFLGAFSPSLPVPLSSSVASPSAASPNKSGSRSTQRSTSNELMPMIFERSTLERSAVKTTANWLMPAMRALIAASSSGDTKSTLFKMMRSAKATCCTASLTAPSGLTSSRCAATCFASARQTTESISKLSSIHWFDLIVEMIGAGSARPVVSSMTASNCVRFCTSEPSVRTRSPRIEQHAHPLSIWMRSSLEAMFSVTSFSSMLISPYSFSMTQIRFSRCSVNM